VLGSDELQSNMLESTRTSNVEQMPSTEHDFSEGRQNFDLTYNGYKRYIIIVALNDIYICFSLSISTGHLGARIFCTVCSYLNYRSEYSRNK
jgi:hypothetical protein